MGSGGPGGAKDYELLGTGLAVTSDIYSPTVAVKPGHTYTFSAWVDLSKVTSGYAKLWIINTPRNVIYEQAAVSPASPGRYVFSVKIPDNVASVRLGFYSNGATIQKAQKIKFALPRFTEAKISISK